MELTQIGVIHSPYQERGDAPRQGRLSENEITIEVFPEFADGLKAVDKLSHIIVLYWGDRANRETLQSFTPFNQEEMLGVFATRSPNRPNPIAFCVGEVLHREDNVLTVRGVDALEGSPLLDIKGYSPAIDCVPTATSWRTNSEDLAGAR